MSQLSTPELLTKLQELKPTLKAQYKVESLALFGSFARQEQRLESDIDILVTFASHADLFDLVGLSLYLEDLFQHPVDVVPQRALRPELKEAVLRDLIAV